MSTARGHLGTPYTATTVRVLRQLRNDHRTVAMILVVPALLMTLLYFIYRDTPTAPHQAQSLFDRVGMSMLGILPFVVMFLITAIAMQRERSSGTLERLLTTPLSKLQLLGGTEPLSRSRPERKPLPRASCPSGYSIWMQQEIPVGSF